MCWGGECLPSAAPRPLRSIPPHLSISGRKAPRRRPRGSPAARGATPPARSPSGRTGRTETPLCRPDLLFPPYKNFLFFRRFARLSRLRRKERGRRSGRARAEGEEPGCPAKLPARRAAPRGPVLPGLGAGSSPPACAHRPGKSGPRERGWGRPAERGGGGDGGGGSNPAREPPFSPGLRKGSRQPLWAGAGAEGRTAAAHWEGSPRPQPTIANKARGSAGAAPRKKFPRFPAPSPKTQALSWGEGGINRDPTTPRRPRGYAFARSAHIVPVTKTPPPRPSRTRYPAAPG